MENKTKPKFDEIVEFEDFVEDFEECLAYGYNNFYSIDNGYILSFDTQQMNNIEDLQFATSSFYIEISISKKTERFNYLAKCSTYPTAFEEIIEDQTIIDEIMKISNEFNEEG